MQINTDKLTLGEIELIQWQYQGLSSFKERLWKAISTADSANLVALERGYPEQVKAYRAFGGTEGYWHDVLVRAELVKPMPATNEGEESH
jgi:hypothetical protein